MRSSLFCKIACFSYVTYSRQNATEDLLEHSFLFFFLHTAAKQRWQIKKMPNTNVTDFTGMTPLRFVMVTDSRKVIFDGPFVVSDRR